MLDAKFIILIRSANLRRHVGILAVSTAIIVHGFLGPSLLHLYANMVVTSPIRQHISAKTFPHKEGRPVWAISKADTCTENSKMDRSQYNLENIVA